MDRSLVCWGSSLFLNQDFPAYNPPKQPPFNNTLINIVPSSEGRQTRQSINVQKRGSLLEQYRDWVDPFNTFIDNKKEMFKVQLVW